MDVSEPWTRRAFLGASATAAFTFLSGAFLSGCSDEKEQASRISADLEAVARAFFDDCDAEDMKRSPVAQTLRGIKDDYSRWDEVSEAHSSETLAIEKKRLNTLNGFDASRLSPSLAFEIALYRAVLERGIAAAEFRGLHYAIEPFNGWHRRIPALMIEYHRISSKADADAYIMRLHGVEELLNAVMADMSLKASHGVYAPRWAYPQMIETVRGVLSGAPFEPGKPDSALLADFRRKIAVLDISDVEKEELIAKASGTMTANVLTAYQNLAAKLKADSMAAPAGDGAARLPGGAAYYRERLFHYTSARLAPEKMHALGRAHVETVHKAMTETVRKMGFAGTLKDFFARIRNGDASQYPDTAEGRKVCRADTARIIAAARAKLPEVFGEIPNPNKIVSLPEFCGGTAMEETSPDGLPEGSRYALPARIHRDIIPGRLLRSAFLEARKDVPALIKNLDFPAYSKGWDIYAAGLAKEMGLSRTPEAEFGRLALELLAGCLLVADTGIHAMNWSREDAIRYLLDNTPMSAGDCAKAAGRVCVLPGEALAALTGKLKIESLRGKAEKALGAKFSLRAFHDAILGAGPMPCDLLERRTYALIAALRR